MIPIENCPDCGATLEIPEEQVGTRVECPDCRCRFLARPLRENRREDAGDDDRPSNRQHRGRRSCPECGSPVGKRDRYCPECDAPLSTRKDHKLSDAGSKKIAAGICAILLGTWGVHKFILGYTGAGVIMLLVSLLTCFLAAPIMSVIGIVEGIIYLTKSDEDFYRIYMAGKKEWF